MPKALAEEARATAPTKPTSQEQQPGQSQIVGQSDRRHLHERSVKQPLAGKSLNNGNAHIRGAADKEGASRPRHLVNKAPIRSISRV